MVTKTKLAALMVVFMAFSAPVVHADMAVAPATMQVPHENMMATVLNLSDDQVKQMEDNHQKQKEAMKALKEQFKANREAFDAEIAKATPDMNKVNDLQTQLKALESQKADSHLNALLDIKRILTPEQFAGFIALKREHEMKKERKMWMGHAAMAGFGKNRCILKGNAQVTEDQD